ncbi:unnamed protein product [Pleuronectes platessa]|uniref:Uncharacterized protein n=1 Tax=Pleuronectes platessa TaxID=8262 RepID=A0A9N7Z2Z4_PLEPL|nr:unnamed protein product [Pleuronectes platessa]
MWSGDRDPLDYKMPYGERSIASNFEVAVQALVSGTGGDYEYELVRILPTRLARAAFLLWDSLPKTVQTDYSAVKVTSYKRRLDKDIFWIASEQISPRVLVL